MIARVIVIASLAALGVLGACNDAPQIAGPTGLDGSRRGSSSPNLEIDDQDGGGSDSSIGDLSAEKDEEDKPKKYPLLDLHGAGSLSCDGDRYNTVAKYKVKVSDEKLELDFYVGKVTSGGSKVTSKANPQIAEKLGLTTYRRPTKKQREKAMKDGFHWASYAIFANKVTKSNGVNFEFEEPLPVFPFPVAQSRYAELSKGAKSWTTRVTGGPVGPFTATVSMELVNTSGDDLTLKMTLSIPEDVDRSVYEDFPVPKEATYLLNSKTQDVRRVDATNWYRGDSQCDGRPEDITVSYNLCTKTVEGEEPKVFNCME